MSNHHTDADLQSPQSPQSPESIQSPLSPRSPDCDTDYLPSPARSAVVRSDDHPARKSTVQFPSMDMLASPSVEDWRSGASSPTAITETIGLRSVYPIKVHRGNRAIDIPVPPQIVPHAHIVEIQSHLRYTPATCHPDGFVASRRLLRSYLQTELLVVITVSDEDEKLFIKTMNAVIQNIAHLCVKSKPWDHNAWQKVVVCIVGDGRREVNERTLRVLQLMGCYQGGVAKSKVGEDSIIAHIFEYTSSTVVSQTYEAARGPTPIQIIFCLKEQSLGKLNSHRWAFKAFGSVINPKVCILLEVGTQPMKGSFFELWQCFNRNSLVGGACGEITVEAGRWGFVSLLKSPLTAFQHFEYKSSNIFDKPFESVFGYISVLPSAFCAYRYEAILGEPLAMYLNGRLGNKGVSSVSQITEAANDNATVSRNGRFWDRLWARLSTEKDLNASKELTLAELFQRNMYLAEDRVLCFEIVTKKDNLWILKFVKAAKASTEVPTTVDTFVSQRRRWLNGSLFAAISAIVFQYRIWKSGQGILRKIALQVELLYKMAQALFVWTSLANFYLAFYFLLSSATIDAREHAFHWRGQGAGSTIFNVFHKIYIGLLLVVLVCSLGNRLQGSRLIFGAVSALFGICWVVALWSAGFAVRLVVQRWQLEEESIGSLLAGGTFRDIILPLAAACGLYFVGICLHEDSWNIICSVIQYVFLLPSYITILMSFTISHFDDIDRGCDTGPQDVIIHPPNDNEDAGSAWDTSQLGLQQSVQVNVARDDTKIRVNRARNLRANVALAWVCTNLILMVFFTSDTYLDVSEMRGEESVGGLFNPYLAFLCYSLFLSTLIHFLGSSLYLILLLYVRIYQVEDKQESPTINTRPGQTETPQSPQGQQTKPVPKASSFPATRHDPRAPRASVLSALRKPFRISQGRGNVHDTHDPPAAVGSDEKL